MTNNTKGYIALTLCAVGIAVPLGLWAEQGQDHTPPSPPKNLHANPGTPPGRYCVRAKDAAGNLSKPACVVVPKRPTLNADKPRRTLDVEITLGGLPNVTASPGSAGGLAPSQVYQTVRFSVDGKLLKTRSAPPYTLTNLPVGGPHTLTVTALAGADASSRVVETYSK